MGGWIGEAARHDMTGIAKWTRPIHCCWQESGRMFSVRLRPERIGRVYERGALVRSLNKLARKLYEPDKREEIGQYFK